MNELDLQALTTDAVNSAGGRAHKMNNRFLVGVSDLLVKLPDWPAGFLEVKQRSYPTTDDRFALDVTRPQQKFLREFDQAGMPCGIASFLQLGTGSGLRLWLCVMTWQTINYSDSTIEPFTLSRTAHWPLSKPPTMRAQEIVNHLDRWMRDWKSHK